MSHFSGNIEEEKQLQKSGTKDKILYCSKCQAHGQLSTLKGHKRTCSFKTCGCLKCHAVDLDRFCNLTSHRICKQRKVTGEPPMEQR